MSTVLFSLARILSIIFAGYQTLGQPFGKGAFGVIIPCDAAKVGHDVNQDYVNKVIDGYLTTLSETFGGFTALSSGFGGWTNHNGSLIKEDVIVAIAFCDKPTFEQVGAIESLACKIKFELYQDCVTAIAGGKAFLVDKDF